MMGQQGVPTAAPWRGLCGRCDPIALLRRMNVELLPLRVGEGGSGCARRGGHHVGPGEEGAVGRRALELPWHQSVSMVVGWHRIGGGTKRAVRGRVPGALTLLPPHNTGGE